MRAICDCLSACMHNTCALAEVHAECTCHAAAHRCRCSTDPPCFCSPLSLRAGHEVSTCSELSQSEQGSPRWVTPPRQVTPLALTPAAGACRGDTWSTLMGLGHFLIRHHARCVHKDSVQAGGCAAFGSAIATVQQSTLIAGPTFMHGTSLRGTPSAVHACSGARVSSRSDLPKCLCMGYTTPDQPTVSRFSFLVGRWVHAWWHMVRGPTPQPLYRL